MPLSTSVTYQIAQYLDNNSIGTFAVDLFCSKEPDSPDNCVTIYSTGGIPDEYLDSTSRNCEILNFQVRVRGNDYLTAHEKVESIKTLLHKTEPTVNDISMQTWLTGLPIELQRDSKNRCIIVANYSCLRHLTPGD